ncbi:MAG TPA: hypothetical protein VFS09_12165 [Candidatus Eisenbacteria bacterium]|nr:hypothetical protein [Candidatus Eisenbacteria bacterium]
MKRIHAGLSATSLALAVGALLALGANRAASQSTTGHEHHAGASAGAGEGSQAEAPTPVGDGKRVSLPGVPPGKLVIGGGVATTITVEVMDPACFLEAGSKSIGKGHYQCAIDCVKSGQTLALYDRAIDRIYFIAGELPGRNPNEPLLPYIHQKVDVTGTVYHRSQAWGIVIVRVVPHKEKAAVAPATTTPPASKPSGSGKK